MTLLVAVTDGPRVRFGTDGRASDASGDVCTTPKAWIVRGCVVGATGNLRAMQIARDIFEWPARPARVALDRWLSATIVPALHDCLSAVGLARSGGSADEHCYPISLLVAMPGVILEVDQDGGVIDRAPFYAVGAGSGVALGVLETAPDPMQAVRLALEVAARRNIYIGPPFSVNTYTRATLKDKGP